MAIQDCYKQAQLARLHTAELVKALQAELDAPRSETQNKLVRDALDLVLIAQKNLTLATVWVARVTPDTEVRSATADKE